MFQLSFLILKISKYCLCSDKSSECSIENNNPKMDDQDAMEAEDTEGGDVGSCEENFEVLRDRVEREFEGSSTIYRNQKMISLNHLLIYKKISAKKFKGSENQWKQVEQRLIKRQILLHKHMEDFEGLLPRIYELGYNKNGVFETFSEYFRDLMLSQDCLKSAKDSNEPILEKILEEYKDSKKSINLILKSKILKGKRWHPISEVLNVLSKFLDVSVSDLKFIVFEEKSSEGPETKKGTDK